MKKRNFIDKWMVFFLILVLGQVSSAFASSGPSRFGLGVQLGEPTGFTAKSYLQPNVALDLAVAYSFNKRFVTYSDLSYQYRLHLNTRTPFNNLSPSIGVGFGVRIRSEDKRH